MTPGNDSRLAQGVARANGSGQKICPIHNDDFPGRHGVWPDRLGSLWLGDALSPYPVREPGRGAGHPFIYVLYSV